MIYINYYLYREDKEGKNSATIADVRYSVHRIHVRAFKNDKRTHYTFLIFITGHAIHAIAPKIILSLTNKLILSRRYSRADGEAPIQVSDSFVRVISLLLKPAIV